MLKTKGVILCGGKGTRLRPATLTINKHLIPIINEPMILYPLNSLKGMGITDIMIITGGDHVGAFAEFLGDGSDYGVSLTYRVQKEAGGIAQALLLAEDFYTGYDGHVVAILGDNIFDETIEQLPNYFHNDDAYIFLQKVDDPRRFGVAVISDMKPQCSTVEYVVEKPEVPPADGYAVLGLYMYPKNVFEIIKTLTPSARGELEITDVTNEYVKSKKCKGVMYYGFWSDAGTPESLLEVANWVFSRK